MCRGVEHGGIRVDQSGRRAQLVGDELRVVVVGFRGDELGARYTASVRPLPMNAAGSTARAPTPARLQSLEPRWDGLPLGRWRSSRQRMWSEPVGAGKLRFKPKIPCWPGATPVVKEARLVGVGDGKVGRARRASGVSGEHRRQQWCIGGQFG